jgi:CBS domain-containing protein
MEAIYEATSGALPVGAVAGLFKSSDIVVVVNGPAKWITFDEIVKAIRPTGVASDIMDPPATCSHHDRVTHVRRRMIDENKWWMTVIEQDKLVGIITENDIAKAMSQFRDVVKSHYQNSRVRKLLVDDIMVADVVFARTNTLCEAVVDLMLKHDVEGVPILNPDDAVVGVITQSTVLRNLD